MRKIIKLFKKEELEFSCCECCNGLGIKYKDKYITYNTICELEDLIKELEEYREERIK